MHEIKLKPNRGSEWGTPDYEHPSYWEREEWWVMKEVEPRSWKYEGIELVDEQCPIHGDNADGDCWPCHVAGVQADPTSCEPED